MQAPCDVIDWIRTAAIPLDTVEPRQGWCDLEALRPIIGDARILSLGEATHGTREFFKLKHRILEYCVAELGFTTFIIEANFPESLAVNAYVLDGVGTAADALTGMRFWVWDTEEVLDLIEWMRWWNLGNARKVKFYGYLMSYPAIATQRLIEYLDRVSPDLADTCRSELAPLANDFTADLLGRSPLAHRGPLLAFLARILSAFSQQRARWITATSATDWHLARLLGILLDQAARLEVEHGFSIGERTAAQNVCALLEAEGPHAKAVLWSHNVHAARDGSSHDNHSMGRHLDGMVGRAQVVIGFSFDRGAFQARTYPTLQLEDHNVPFAPSGSFDGALAQAGLPLFALDLSVTPRDEAAAAWLASETSMRSIGGIYGIPEGNKLGVAYTNTIVPRDHFDAVLFVAETTAARRNQSYGSVPKSIATAAPTNLELLGDGVPLGWSTAAHRKYAHAIAMSDETSPCGRRALRIRRDAPWHWGEGRLSQKVAAQEWHGRRLRFSAAVRTAVSDIGAGALVFLRFLPKSDGDEGDVFAVPIATVASGVQPMQSPQWTTISVEAAVPQAADAIELGLIMTGNGATWFGDLEFAASSHSDS